MMNEVHVLVGLYKVKDLLGRVSSRQISFLDWAYDYVEFF